MIEQVALPEKLKEWRIVNKIGVGAFGVVYEAISKAGEQCAIKYIRVPDTEAQAEQMRRELLDEESLRKYYSSVVEDLMVEIKTMERLKHHANVVKILDYAVEERKDFGWDVYIVMELLQSLATFRTEHKITEDLVLKIGIDICQILVECEKQQILHRDIKPDNIMVDQNATFKLGDFGVAKKMEATTGTMSVKGTFQYMAPEIYHGENYKKTADIYSLALVLYRMVNANKEPFLDTSRRMVLRKEREEALTKRMGGTVIPAPIHASKEFAEVLQCALEFHPYKRFQSAEEFLKYLKKIQNKSYVLGEIKKEKRISSIPIAQIKNGFLKKKRWLPLLIGGMSCALVIGSGYTFWNLQNRNPDRLQASLEEWTIEKEEIADDHKEDVRIENIKRMDEKLWRSLKAGDQKQSFTKEKWDVLNHYYHVDQLQNAKYTQAQTEKYQQENTSYVHLVCATDEWQLYEVLRYVAYSEKDTADDKYHGDVIKASMFYLVNMDSKEESIEIITGEELLTEKSEYLEPILYLIPDMPEQLDWNMTDGVLDFTWLDDQFTYGSYSRLSVVASYIKEGEIVFVISAKNGLQSDVTIQDISIEMKKYNQSFQFKEVDWLIEKNTAQTSFARFALSKELPQLNDDEWIVSYNDDTGLLKE